ncbi:unnamed protein product [Adineta ricciae]|uniref:Transposase n=1 Tax=Adineta ricciae TaxID=249248 RepID=A0A815NXZ4_ADIRI|nr:unnamed protein product [Adineta ricciae]CAF1440877.1 unnamed protein product [Adineta ricciae]
MAEHLSIRQRWTVITLHQDSHLSLRTIASRVNCSFSTVRNIIQLYEETHDVIERQGRGRRRLIDGPVRRYFRQIMSQHPTDTSFSIANRLQQHSGVTVSARTIREACRNENFHPVHARAHWQINEHQAARCFQYCYTHRLNNWRQVIFTDEKKFQVDQAGFVYWVPIGAPRPRTFVGQVKYQVTVFGAIWFNQRSHLVFIQGSSNSTTYLQQVQLALGNYQQRLHGYSFIHDRTTWSNSIMVHDWLASFGIDCMDDYPSVSPELNPIESVWGWMNRYVQSRHPRSQRHLEVLVRQAWQEIPIITIRVYIQHVRTIIQMIIAAQGWDVDA